MKRSRLIEEQITYEPRTGVGRYRQRMFDDGWAAAKRALYEEQKSLSQNIKA